VPPVKLEKVVGLEGRSGGEWWQSEWYGLEEEEE